MFKKHTTVIKYKDGSFTIDYYSKNYIIWIPIARIIDIFEIPKKDFIKYVGRHAIGNIEDKEKNIKIRCCDSIALLRLNEIILDEIFYKSILNMSVWRNHIYFQTQIVLDGLKEMESLQDNKEFFYNSVNFYDRVKCDLYHTIEKTDNNLNNQLKHCLNIRRIFKIKHEVSKQIELYTKDIKKKSLINCLSEFIKSCKEEKYNPRLTNAEQVTWENELSKKDLM